MAAGFDPHSPSLAQAALPVPAGRKEVGCYYLSKPIRCGLILAINLQRLKISEKKDGFPFGCL
jgi:hypothetical protein